MFVETDITDVYREELTKINVCGIEDMLTILNGLDYIAEIGYSVYKNNQLIQNEKAKNN